jgi:hypothetical protein
MLGDDPSAKRKRFSISDEASATACRLAMSCLYECAKSIASFRDSIPYPSKIFLMKRLPDVLFPYFPKEFDFNAPVVDRETFVEIVHLPYAAHEQRREHRRRPAYSLNALSCWYYDCGDEEDGYPIEDDEDYEEDGYSIEYDEEDDHPIEGVPRRGRLSD